MRSSPHGGLLWGSAGTSSTTGYARDRSQAAPDVALLLESQSPEEPAESEPDPCDAVAAAGRAWRKTLHQLPGCGRIPGVHYSSYALYDLVPEAAEYSHNCRNCWPSDGPSQPEQEQGASASPSDMTLSSSSIEWT